MYTNVNFKIMQAFLRQWLLRPKFCLRHISGYFVLPKIINFFVQGFVTPSLISVTTLCWWLHDDDILKMFMAEPLKIGHQHLKTAFI